MSGQLTIFNSSIVHLLGVYLRAALSSNFLREYVSVDHQHPLSGDLVFGPTRPHNVHLCLASEFASGCLIVGCVEVVSVKLLIRDSLQFFVHDSH